MTTALLYALALSIGLGGFGWLIQTRVWSGEPLTPVDYGRKFSSYALLATCIASGNLFIKNDLPLALIKLLMVLLIFGFAGFVLGYIFGKIKAKRTPPPYHTNTGDISLSKKHTSNNIMVKLLLISASTFIFYIYSQSANKILKNEKWIQISNRYKYDWMESDGKPKFEWIDENSIQKANHYTYAQTGIDIETRTVEGGIFKKFKIEADCAVPKYRIIEAYIYTKGVDEGFGELISEDKDFQRTYRNKMLDIPSFVYTGGWNTKSDALDDLNRYSSLADHKYGHMIAIAKVNLAILSFVCN
jgi:hypothetical protein